MEKLKKQRGNEYYRIALEKIMETQKEKGVVLFQDLEKIFDSADKEMGLTPKSRSHAMYQYLIKNLKTRVQEYWGEKKVQRNGKCPLKGIYITVDLKNDALRKKVLDKFGTTTEQKKVVVQGYECLPVAGGTEGYHKYILNRALALEEDEMRPGKPTVAAVNAVREELGHMPRKITFQSLMKVLSKVKTTESKCLKLRQIGQLLGWSTFSIQNLEDWVKFSRKFELGLKYDIPNAKGKGVKNVYFRDIDNTLARTKKTYEMIFGVVAPVLPEGKTAVSIKQQPKKTEEVVQVQEKRSAKEEDYILFITAGLLYKERQSLGIDDIVKVLRDSTFIRYNGGKRDLVKLLKNYPKVVEVFNGGDRVCLLDRTTAWLQAKDNYSPFEVVSKIQLISGSSISLKDIEKYFPGRVQKEYEYNGVALFEISINSSYHDMLQLIDLKKIMRDGIDKIIASDEEINKIELQEKVEHARRMVRQSSMTPGYNADLAIFEIEKMD